MNIVDWFDPSNIEHIKIYDHLRKTGLLSKIPKEVTLIPPTWQIHISYKIADYFVDQTLLVEQALKDIKI